MISVQQGVKTDHQWLSRILGWINPLRDPSLTVALVLTFVEEAGTGDPLSKILLLIVLNWLAVRIFVWLVVNFSFTSVFLARKLWWSVCHPQLAWRILDALGTEQIIIGPFQADNLTLAGAALLDTRAAIEHADTGVVPAVNATQTLDTAATIAQLDQMQQALASYARLVGDWASFTEEKWRTVSDSQLGWKPLRGRWGSWDDIYSDSYGARTSDPIASVAQAAAEAIAPRFENARDRGSAASSVACFLRDLETLRRGLSTIALPKEAATILINTGSYPSLQNRQQNTGSFIRRPAEMFVEAQ
jgi:hypothetical protein